MADVVPNRPVVVGVDGSESATHAVRWAVSEAVRREAPLVVVYSYVFVPITVPLPIAAPHSYRAAAAEQGRQWLAEAAAIAAEAAPGLDVTTELTEGGPAEQLVGRSASAQLVVLGSRGLGGFSGLLVGSIAVNVAMHSQCPVVVVRGTQPPQNGPVVLGVDGSSSSQDAIPFAFDAAAARGVPLVAVHAWSDIAYAGPWDTGLAAVDWQALQSGEQQLLGGQLAAHQANYPQVEVRQVVTPDRPARTLLQQAEDAQLVVVGSRGRGGFRGLLLGSTSQALIHHAACPVAVVPRHHG
ncbi:MAG: universal stress protein [Kibdelosporangium sp.]